MQIQEVGMMVEFDSIGQMLGLCRPGLMPPLVRLGTGEAAEYMYECIKSCGAGGGGGYQN